MSLHLPPPSSATQNINSSSSNSGAAGIGVNPTVTVTGEQQQRERERLTPDGGDGSSDGGSRFFALSDFERERDKDAAAGMSSH